MLRSRILLTLALTATLATPCAYGAPREERTSPVGLIEQIWGFVTAIWNELSHGIDPQGVNSTSQDEGDPAPEPDLGHGLDPHG
jgi:hypothetical protein